MKHKDSYLYLKDRTKKICSKRETLSITQFFE